GAMVASDEGEVDHALDTRAHTRRDARIVSRRPRRERPPSRLAGTTRDLHEPEPGEVRTARRGAVLIPASDFEGALDRDSSACAEIIVDRQIRAVAARPQRIAEQLTLVLDRIVGVRVVADARLMVLSTHRERAALDQA